MSMMMGEEELLLFHETNGTEISSFSEPYSLNVTVPLSVIYGIIFLTGISGNISTCIVIARNRYMHTGTYLYLFSLAISDLFLLICGLPLEVYALWNPFSYPFGEAPCITVGLLLETSANATILTITAVTVERYIAICRPFLSHKMSKLSRALKYIRAIWICALIFALPQALQFEIITYEENGQKISTCSLKGEGLHEFFVISSFIFFLVPMSLITVLYILIGAKLHTSVLHPINDSSVKNAEQSNDTPHCAIGASQRRVIRMLVVVAFSFFLCWAPFHAQRLLAIYGRKLKHPTDTFHKVYVILTHLSGVLYFLSTAMNPILYNIMSKKFRNAFKSLHRSNLMIVTAKSASWWWRERVSEGPNTLTSLQSISNSSLREVDQELSGEKLELYQVNCKTPRDNLDTLA